ncbi:SdrD B-like domain-containing protein [Thiothrix nivea]|uniref:SdrD B-like domain-containing protein n=1 Tax=Thiothrix nivea TaxID=1031 RepID=UPI00031A6EAA|nr:SdrD B-like domain-containing protein [Thiothrix nivea]
MQSKKWGHLGLGILLLSSQAAHADISGKVFRDFNSNGVFDTGASFNEVGMAGVTVKAFAASDPVSTPTSTATSGVNGSYTLTGLTGGASYRLEFSWAESWLKPGVASGTTVQFVQDGISNADMAVNNPAQYCQANPEVATTRMIPDDKVDKPTVLSFDYDSTGDDRSTLTELAHGSDHIGSTWGVAYRRDTKKLYVSSVLRRHTSEGSLGFGGIYELDASNSAAAPVNWLSITSAGSMTNPRGIPGDGSPSHDVEAYQKLGKMSLGDIDISEDGKTLYVMNLNTRSLVPVDIDTKPEFCINLMP